MRSTPNRLKYRYACRWRVPQDRRGQGRERAEHLVHAEGVEVLVGGVPLPLVGGGLEPVAGFAHGRPRVRAPGADRASVPTPIPFPCRGGGDRFRSASHLELGLRARADAEPLAWHPADGGPGCCPGSPGPSTIGKMKRAPARPRTVMSMRSFVRWSVASILGLSWGVPAVSQTGSPPPAPKAIAARLALQAATSRRGRASSGRKAVGRAAVFERALRIAEAEFGPESLEVADALSGLGFINWILGDALRAEKVFRRELGVRTTKQGENHSDTARAVFNLGAQAMTLGRYAEAEALYRKALAVREKVLGADHEETAFTLGNLGDLCRLLGRDAEAEAFLARAAAICEKRYGPDHPETTLSLNNLGMFYMQTGRLADAEPALEQALAANERRLGPDHPGTADSLASLASLYIAMRRLPEAEALVRRALVVMERRLGPDHPRTAKARGNLAALRSGAGAHREAAELYARVAASLEKVLGRDHPDTLVALSGAAIARLHDGAVAEAAASVDAERRRSRSFMLRTLPALPPSDQMTLRHQQADSFRFAASLPLTYRDHPDLVVKAGEWVVNGKAVVHEALAVAARLTATAGDPAEAAIVRELLQVRRRMAHLSFAPPPASGDVALRTQLAALADAENVLLRRLGGGRVSPPPADWVGLDQLRTAIPADAVLLEFALPHPRLDEGPECGRPLAAAPVRRLGRSPGRRGGRSPRRPWPGRTDRRSRPRVARPPRSGLEVESRRRLDRHARRARGRALWREAASGLAARLLPGLREAAGGAGLDRFPRRAALAGPLRSPPGRRRQIPGRIGANPPRRQRPRPGHRVPRGSAARRGDPRRPGLRLRRGRPGSSPRRRRDDDAGRQSRRSSCRTSTPCPRPAARPTPSRLP